MTLMDVMERLVEENIDFRCESGYGSKYIYVNGQIYRSVVGVVPIDVLMKDIKELLNQLLSFFAHFSYLNIETIKEKGGFTRMNKKGLEQALSFGATILVGVATTMLNQYNAKKNLDHVTRQVGKEISRDIQKSFRKEGGA